MSDFWAYPGADILAIILMVVLCVAALILARFWTRKL